jgi:hypothetical protein
VLGVWAPRVPGLLVMLATLRHSPLPCQDNTRISTAGCLGELCAFLTDEELNTVLQQCLLGRSLQGLGRSLDTCSPPP